MLSRQTRGYCLSQMETSPIDSSEKIRMKKVRFYLHISKGKRIFAAKICGMPHKFGIKCYLNEKNTWIG